MFLSITYIILACFANFNVCDDLYTNRDKIGTVLFSESDNLRTCWSDEHIAMLTSRMYFEDLLPANNMFNIQDDHFINALIEYFQMVTDTVKRSTEGKAKHVLLNSLCDCLGGYLHHTALPLGRHAYYSGNIHYDSMERIYDLYDEIKEFLRTDGKAWAAPITDFSQFKNKVLPLPIMAEEEEALPCHDLVYYENENGENGLSIPLPFFDSDTKPHAIAVPYHNMTLRNVEGRSSAFIIVKYYTDAVKCLAHKKADNASLYKYYRDLNNWIHTYVLPRVSDNRFYSAFGGIYRLKETLKRNIQLMGLGVKPQMSQYELLKIEKSKHVPVEKKKSEHNTIQPGLKSKKRSVYNNYDYMTDIGRKIVRMKKKQKESISYFDEPYFWDENLKMNVERTTQRSFWYNWNFQSTTSIIMCNIFLVVIFLWFLVGTLYLCYRMYKRRYGRCGTFYQRKRKVTKRCSRFNFRDKKLLRKAGSDSLVSSYNDCPVRIPVEKCTRPPNVCRAQHHPENCFGEPIRERCTKLVIEKSSDECPPELFHPKVILEKCPEEDPQQVCPKLIEKCPKECPKECLEECPQEGSQKKKFLKKILKKCDIIKSTECPSNCRFHKGVKIATKCDRKPLPECIPEKCQACPVNTKGVSCGIPTATVETNTECIVNIKSKACRSVFDNASIQTNMDCFREKKIIKRKCEPVQASKIEIKKEMEQKIQTCVVKEPVIRKTDKPFVYGYEYYSTDSSISDTTSTRFTGKHSIVSSKCNERSSSPKTE